MDRCPNCDQKVRVEGSSGVFGTKNFFLSDELVKEINSFLPKELIRDKISTDLFRKLLLWMFFIMGIRMIAEALL